MGRILLTMMFAASCAFSAELTWQPNTDEDLQGYLVYYGKESGQYTRSIDVGNVKEYTIEDLDEGETYFFIITAYDRWGNESEAAPEVSYRCGCTDVPTTDGTGGPAEFTLAQNYPNPFNPETTIGYSVDEPGPVTLTVFNALGRVVRTLVDARASIPNEQYSVVWDGRNDAGMSVASGRYYYRFLQGDRSITKQMTFLK